jgi:hypothetical protein
MNPAHGVVNELNQQFVVNPLTLNGTPKTDQEIRRESLAIYRRLMYTFPSSAAEARAMIRALRIRLTRVVAITMREEIEERIVHLRRQEILLENPEPVYPVGHMFPLGQGAAAIAPAFANLGNNGNNGNNGQRRRIARRGVKRSRTQRNENNEGNMTHIASNNEGNEGEGSNNYNTNFAGRKYIRRKKNESNGGAKRKSTTTKRKSTTTKRKSTTTKRKSTTTKRKSTTTKRKSTTRKY